jgi:hypothetical protein
MLGRIGILITCEMTAIGERRFRDRYGNSVVWPSAKQIAFAPTAYAAKPLQRFYWTHDAAPTLFGAKDLAAVARTGLETDIARNIDFGQSAASTAAVRDALRQRGDAYAREQRCQLIAERHPNATIVSESVKKACDDGAPDAAALILAGRPFPKANNHVRLTEDLLAQASGGGGQ